MQRRHSVYRSTEFDSSKCPLCGRLNDSEFTVCYTCSQFVPEHSSSWEKDDAEAKTFYVYILELNDGGLYVGQTRDLKRRVCEHKAGDSVATADKDPKLIWYNTVETREQATNLELQLKHTQYQVKRKMIAQFNIALKGALPTLATRSDVNEIRTTLNAALRYLANHSEIAEARLALETRMAAVRSAVIVASIGLATLAIALTVYVTRFS